MFPIITAHHEGAIDPDLLDAIMHRIDTMFGVDGWAAVLILGAIILLIPDGAGDVVRVLPVQDGESGVG